jgi:hypothetical protein
MNKELRELVRPALAARMESSIEELWHDEELWKNARVRFERGILNGRVIDGARTRDLRAFKPPGSAGAG